MAQDTKKRALTPITQQDIEALEKVLADLKSGAMGAYKAGNLTTLRIYQRLVKIVAPEVHRAVSRLERQEEAQMNKDAHALKGQLNTTNTKSS